MMHSAPGAPPPMAPPSMDQQGPPQQWMTMPPPQTQQMPPPQTQQMPPPYPQQYQQQPHFPPAQVPPPQAMWQQPHVAAQPPQMQQVQTQYPSQPPQQQQPPASADEIRTLWIGDLQYWMDEAYLHGCFSHTNEVSSVKIIRNKQSGQSEGYGFIEFVSRAAADRILQSYNGTLMPNSEQAYRLNWASYGVGEKRPESGPEFTIFVGDLASDVSDYVLQETFKAHYTSIKGAKVVTDRITGRSKGYGFVKFGDESEQLRAMTEMNGMFCSTRPMRIGLAATKKAVGVQQPYPTKAPDSNSQSTQSENDPNNTTIFVGGLDPNVTDDILRQVFGQFGELVHVKIPLGKRCGFVQFASRSCAEEALLMLNGTQLGQQAIRLSWGRSPSNKQASSAASIQPQPDPNQWNGGGYYGYAQGYEAYGYAQPPQDPNAYAYGGYPGYTNYPQQQ